MVRETYKKQPDAQNKYYDYRGLPENTKTWREEEDKKRIDSYVQLWKLYKGFHYVGDGGIWQHPYGPKGKSENIPYQQVNLLGKASRVFADLIVGDGIKVVSSDPKQQEFINTINFKQLWESLILSSVFGFCGYQPEGKNKWFVVHPKYLYPVFKHHQPGEVESIYKMILFKNIKTDHEIIDILYEEKHDIGQIETRLYRVQGETVIKEIDLQFYNILIDKDAVLKPVIKTNIDDFLISIVYNDKIMDEIFSDYTPSAQRSQMALNSILTQIDRILKFHSDPKLIAPQSAMVQDPDTGKWFWAYEGSEVLIQNEKDTIRYEYLTWDGQLSTAIERRDNLILSLHTELDITPQLTAFIHLMPGTTAETSAKLKQLLHATIKKAMRKKDFLKTATEKLIKNILLLNGFSNPDFAVIFPELIPQSKLEILEEIILKKQNGLITTPDAIIAIDGIPKDEADKKAAEIHNEKMNEIASSMNNFNQDTNIENRYFPEIDNKEEGIDQ